MSTLRHSRSTRPPRRDRGFTLVETMVTLVVMALVMIVIMSIVYALSRNKTATSNRIESSQGARVAIDLISKDLRSAGYATDRDSPSQPPIAYIDSVQVLINEDLQPYPDTTSLLGVVQPGTPQAYNPAGSPKPFQFNATAWTPQRKFLTGAETIRWTLDVNNDGQIDANDQAGTDAAKTLNPNDYVLVRQVYGDSSGTPLPLAGNNGGTQENLALLLKPGGAVPPIFTVYMRGSSTPYNWSNGPVPTAQLTNIERVVVNITAASAKPDSKGAYAQTQYTTDVSSMRNVPTIGDPEYTVDGYVFNDLDKDQLKGPSDIGIANATVRLGPLSTTTGSSGYFQFAVPGGTYTLREVAPPGYGVRMNPDSSVVTVPPGTSFSFADTASAGGFIYLNAYEDLNNNGVKDTGEPLKANVKFTLTPGAVTQTSDINGNATLFTGVGSYSVATTAPDSFTVTTTNPLSGTMANGGSASYQVGLYRAPMGTITGKVYVDANKNGTYDATEIGLQNVWVGVTTDAGITIQGFAYTNATGDYSINVPANKPPSTKPYSIMCIPISGYYNTSTSSINNVLVQNAQVLSGQNFGLAAFQIISLTTSRVLCLGSADFVEKDWNAKHTENARKDADIVLGAESGGSDQVSVWFNQYNQTPLFPSTRTYARTAPNSVMCLAVDSLDKVDVIGRADLVTGCKTAAAGNFFVWFCQGTSGNEGYFPLSYNQAYRTQDNGDVQAVLTADFMLNGNKDILVGTNAGGYRGTLEIWQSSGATTPTFSRVEVYPPTGSISGNPSWLGEVSSMTLADLDGDGYQDLIVATKTSSTSGQILFFQANNKKTGARFAYKGALSTSDPATAVTVADVDGDGSLDIIAGVQTSSTTGELQLWHGTSNWNYVNNKTVNPPGIPLTLAAVDLGGVSRKDIVVGYRVNSTSYSGGVRVYQTDSGTLPASGYDPSGGQVTNMVPAMTVANFNYGVKPNQPSPPYLLDLAVGVKITDTTGALVVMIR